LVFILSSCRAIQVESQSVAVTATSTPAAIVQPTTTAPPAQPTTAVEPSSTVEPSPTLQPTPTPSLRVSLMAVGDIMLGRTIGDLILSQGPEAPFLYTSETLQLADITLGNLECPITTRGTPVEKTYAFRAPIDAGQSLAGAGFDLVNLANNHILDYGEVGLFDTLETLAESRVLFVGAGQDETEAYQPIFIEINGLKLAFLGFVDVSTQDYDYQSWEAGTQKPGVAWAYENKVRESVQAAKNEADIVIVLVHNGYEFAQRVSEAQMDTARLAIDSGASLVIGSHPHVLQRIEPYQDGLIVYSMGNFVFDNFLYPPNYSGILSVVLSSDGVESYEMIDVVIQLNGVPQIMPYHTND